MVNIRKCRTIRQAGSVEQASWKKRIATCLDWREDTALAARQGLSAKSGLANVKWINPPSLSMPMCTLLPNHLYFYYITPAVYDRFFVRHFPDSHQIAIVCLAKKVYNTER